MNLDGSADSRGPITLSIDLFQPGMTALHRIGLAGLAMTLQALEADDVAERLRPLGAWDVSERTVTLSWQGDGERFLRELIGVSFRLTTDGLIWLPALGDPRTYGHQAALLHKAMMGTFLQHPRTRGSAGKRPVSRTFEVDDEPFVVTFLPLESYAHQQARSRIVVSRRMDIAGWLYPGGAVRHVQAQAATTLSEDPGRYLALLFAPVGAIYFEIHRRAAGVRPEYCLVLPHVTDLTRYSLVRQSFLRRGVAELQVAGTAEAAVRVLAELAAQGLLGSVTADSCTVVSFGTVPWSKQQKTRVAQFTVSRVPRDELLAYDMARHALPPRAVHAKSKDGVTDATSWWVVPQTPDLVANNIILGQPWWRGFAAMWERMRAAENPRQRQWALTGERSGLQAMITDPRTMPDGAEARLVRACQEAWHRRLGALSDRARTQGLSFQDLARKEFESVRIGFARCKNGPMLRQTLTDFWSRTGAPLSELQEGWVDLLPLLGESWRDARDLALLALASYKPRSREEAGALTKDSSSTAGGATE